MACRWTVLVILAVLLPRWAAAASPAAEAQVAPPQEETAAPEPLSLAEALEALAAYEFGRSRAPLAVVANAVVASHSDPEARKQLEKRLVMLLESGATAAGKRFACRQLRIIGSAEAVPALAALLPDEELSHMARYALERIPGGAAAKALRAALEKLTGTLKVGVINSLGERGDAAAAAALADLAADPHPAIAEAAIAALGKIGNRKAARALTETRRKVPPALQPAASGAYLVCADSLRAKGKKGAALAIYEELYAATEPKPIRIGALRGLVMCREDAGMPLLVEALRGTDSQMRGTAVNLIQDIPGTAATKAFAALLPELPPEGQVALLAALASRGGAAATDAAVAATKSSRAAVRVAALRALASLGDASTVRLLVRVATTGPPDEQREARRSLDRLPGPDVNGAMLAHLEIAEAEVRTELIRSLGARGATQAAPTLLRAARDPEETVRLASLESLGALAGQKDVPALTNLLTTATSDAERSAAERALAAASGRATETEKCAEPVLAALSAEHEFAPATRCALLRVLAKTGTPKGLAAVHDAMKDSRAEIRDTAVRVLAGWPDASPAKDLIHLAASTKDPTHHVLALRGYVRMIGLLASRPAADRLRMCRRALEVARRPEEKRMALAAVAGLSSLEALRLVAPYLDDEAVVEEAGAAAVAIAEKIARTPGEQVAAVLEKVLEVSKNDRLRRRARRVLDRAGTPPPTDPLAE